MIKQHTSTEGSLMIFRKVPFFPLFGLSETWVRQRPSANSWSVNVTFSRFNVHEQYVHCTHRDGKDSQYVKRQTEASYLYRNASVLHLLCYSKVMLTEKRNPPTAGPTLKPNPTKVSKIPYRKNCYLLLQFLDYPIFVMPYPDSSSMTWKHVENDYVWRCRICTWT